MSQQINLFNPIFLKQKKYFSTVTMLQGLGLIVLGSAMFYGYAVYQVTTLGKQVQESEQSFKSEQGRLNKFTGLYATQQKSLLLEAEVKNFEARLKTRRAAVESLKSGVIGNTDGYSEYMRAFARQAIEGLWLTGFTIVGAGSELSLTGRVLRPELVPAYLQRLNRESLLQGKQFAALQIRLPKDDARFLEFTLQSVTGGESSGGKAP